LFVDPLGRGGLAGLTGDEARAREIMGWIAEQRHPCVLMEREAVAGAKRQPVESVVSDHALGAEIAVRHLWELGHRRIGLMVSRDSPTTHKLRIGFQRVCSELGLDVDGSACAVVPDTRRAGFAQAVAQVIDQVVAARTTGLLVHSDREAMALVQHLELRNLKVPRDISVIAYDDEVAEMCTPALTAVQPARGALGKAGVGLLVERLLDPDRAIHRIVISPRLHIRESSAPPPGL
jgi:DNA-binding LacI/PurR family transcriptional regulator